MPPNDTLQRMMLVRLHIDYDAAKPVADAVRRMVQGFRGTTAEVGFAWREYSRMQGENWCKPTQENLDRFWLRYGYFWGDKRMWDEPR